MIELRNPFNDIDGYECFGCAPHNPAGLQMQFFEDHAYVISTWEPKDHFQGYDQVLHGGIQATLMDELASWVVFVKLETAGMTRGMEVTYHKQVRTNAGAVTLRGLVESRNGRDAAIRCHLFQNQVLSSEALCHYVVFPEHIARKRLHYPGIEAFRGSD
ncbi:MAG: PaaI family thioesterase [Spirochaetaceae bacterium]